MRRQIVCAIAVAVLCGAGIAAQIRVPEKLPPATRAGGNITAKPVTGKLPRQRNGRPDLTGLWLRRGGIANIAQGLPKGETMPLRPEMPTMLPWGIVRFTLARTGLPASYSKPTPRITMYSTPPNGVDDSKEPS